MNWETLYCPNRSCSYYGLPFGQGWFVKNGSSHGTKQALCQACGLRIAVTYATAYFGLEAEPAQCELAVRALAEGHSIHATARIVQRDKDTVWDQRGLPTICQPQCINFLPHLDDWFMTNAAHRPPPRRCCTDRLL